MTQHFQFGGWRGHVWLAVMFSLLLAVPAMAGQRAPRFRARVVRQANRPAPAENNHADRPPAANNARAQNAPRADENRPPAKAPFADAQNRWRNMTPQERQRVLQNQRRWQQLSPAQRQELNRRAQVWQRMTPEQRQHIRNDILPAWRQMSPERKQAIRQRLGILQNMPEYARNQRLNDPNFTRGMSDEDKATLRDLSHLHVGGAPDHPNE